MNYRSDKSLKFAKRLHKIFRIVHKQECIQVGCVPTAAVAISGGGSTSTDQTPPAFTRHPSARPDTHLLPGHVTSDAFLGRIGTPPPPPHPLTNTCENITFPHTLYADGKYRVYYHYRKSWIASSLHCPQPHRLHLINVCISYHSAHSCWQ